MALTTEAVATIIFGILGTILTLVGLVLSAKYATAICKLDIPRNYSQFESKRLTFAF